MTIISPDSHRVEAQTIAEGAGEWVIDLQLTGGDHLFDFVAIAT